MKKINAVRMVIAVLAVAALIYGAGRGEPLAVFQKAVIICLECVGIG